MPCCMALASLLLCPDMACKLAQAQAPQTPPIPVISTPAVCRRLRHRGIETDEGICFPLLRACFNALRAHWTPSGYPPQSADRRPKVCVCAVSVLVFIMHSLHFSPGRKPHTRLHAFIDFMTAQWLTQAALLSRSLSTPAVHTTASSHAVPWVVVHASCMLCITAA